MRVLPLYQPYASLVAREVKRIETRHYAPPATLLAQRFAIRATKIGTDWPALERALEAGHLSREDLVSGVIVCTAVLEGCERSTPEFADRLARENPTEYSYGLYRPSPWDGYRDRYAWHLVDVERIDPPHPFVPRGQGISIVPDEDLGYATPTPQEQTLL